MPNRQITAMLASEWREHRDKNTDVYKMYKELDAKQVFFEKNRHVLVASYPTLSEEAIRRTLDKTYEKLKEKAPA
jgi:hypothetical protein